jgi:hypothetical protein
LSNLHGPRVTLLERCVLLNQGKNQIFLDHEWLREYCGAA